MHEKYIQMIILVIKILRVLETLEIVYEERFGRM
jgi:hypothetical protein